MQLTSTRNWLRLDTFRGRLPDEEEDQGLSERPDVRWVKPKAQTHQSAIAAPSPPWAGGNPTPHVLLLCSLPSDTDREIRASFDRQGRATRPVVDPRVSFRSAFLKAFRPLSRPTGEASRHGSGSPVSIEWRSSPARLITSIIAGRHEPAWGRSLAVAYSPWLWRASVCRTEARNAIAGSCPAGEPDRNPFLVLRTAPYSWPEGRPNETHLSVSTRTQRLLREYAQSRPAAIRHRAPRAPVRRGFRPSGQLGRHRRGTDENRAASPSAIVGWVR